MRRVLPLVLLLAACERLNQPLSHPTNMSPSSSSSSSSGGTGDGWGDGGTTTAEGDGAAPGPAPAPIIKPQPGDIQL